MKSYNIPTEFTFRGVFKVKARSQAAAIEQVKLNCGMVLGQGIHSTMPDEHVDWSFPMHPDKVVLKPSKQRPISAWLGISKPT